MPEHSHKIFRVHTLNQISAKGLDLFVKNRYTVGDASIYNAMPIEGVLTLVSFMKEFANNHA